MSGKEVSAEVPTQETFLMLSETVAQLALKINEMQPQLTSEEKAAVQTVIALINRLIGGT